MIRKYNKRQYMNRKYNNRQYMNRKAKTQISARTRFTFGQSTSTHCSSHRKLSLG